MKWISIKDQIPSKQSHILVFSTCGSIHDSIFGYEKWSLVERCYEDGTHADGQSIEFEYWMPLPPPPNTEEKSS